MKLSDELQIDKYELHTRELAPERITSLDLHSEYWNNELLYNRNLVLPVNNSDSIAMLRSYCGDTPAFFYTELEYIVEKFLNNLMRGLHNNYISHNGTFVVEGNYLKMSRRFWTYRPSISDCDLETLAFIDVSSRLLKLRSGDSFSDWQSAILAFEHIHKKLLINKFEGANDVIERVLSKDLSILERRFEYVSMRHQCYGFFKLILDETLGSICYNFLSQYDMDKLSAVRGAKDYHSLEITEDKMLSFSYNGRFQTMKIGKGLKKILSKSGVEINDNTLKVVVSHCTLSIDDYEFVVVEGDDITKYYNQKMYSTVFDTSSLKNSCMRYPECGRDGFFRIYEDNAKMLILKHKELDEIIGRAILWDNVYDIEDEKYVSVMDRIYGNENIYQKFFDWAYENGYWTKRFQTYTDNQSFCSPDIHQEVSNVDRKTFSKLFSIDISLTRYSYLPYMDTFYAGSEECIYNDDERDDTYYTARETDGSLQGRNVYNDDYDDDDC